MKALDYSEIPRLVPTVSTELRYASDLRLKHLRNRKQLRRRCVKHPHLVDWRAQLCRVTIQHGIIHGGLRQYHDFIADRAGPVAIATVAFPRLPTLCFPRIRRDFSSVLSCSVRSPFRSHSYITFLLHRTIELWHEDVVLYSTISAAALEQPRSFIARKPTLRSPYGS